MKIFVHRFFSNDTTLKLEDIIQDLLVFESKELFKVAFNTTDKYVDIHDGIFVCCGKYKGQAIEIQPIIHDSEYNCLEGRELYEHKKYYSLQIVFGGVDTYISSVVALKHQYEVFFIKEARLDKMKPVEIEIIS